MPVPPNSQCVDTVTVTRAPFGAYTGTGYELYQQWGYQKTYMVPYEINMEIREIGKAPGTYKIQSIYRFAKSGKVFGRTYVKGDIDGRYNYLATIRQDCSAPLPRIPPPAAPPAALPIPPFPPAAHPLPPPPPPAAPLPALLPAALPAAPAPIPPAGPAQQNVINFMCVSNYADDGVNSSDLQEFFHVHKAGMEVLYTYNGNQIKIPEYFKLKKAGVMSVSASFKLARILPDPAPLPWNQIAWR